MNTPLPPTSRFPTTRALARSLAATRAQFGALGLIAGAWGAHIPSVKSRHGLDEASLALVLLAGAVGALSTLFFAGRAIERLGVRRATVLAALAMGGAIASVLPAPGWWALLVVMLIFGAGMSLFDVAINAEGSVVESLGGRPVMSQLHGMFSVGGMAGAALVAALLAAGVAPAWQLAGIGAAAAAVVALAARHLLEAHPREAGHDTQAHFAWPRGALLVIGLLILAGMLAEGVMLDWGVLYLAQELHQPQARAALGLAAFSGAMALARFGADALRSRFSPRALLTAGALLAGLSMAMVLLVRDPWWALVGFALVGAGLAPVVPILYAAAAQVGGVSRAAGIASASSIGYAAFMAGPPLVGGLAQAFSLGAALWVVVAAAAALALGARRVP